MRLIGILLLALLIMGCEAEQNIRGETSGTQEDVVQPVKKAFEELQCAKEEEMCGGIVGILCCEGLDCEYRGEYPDAGGQCKKPSVTSNVEIEIQPKGISVEELSKHDNDADCWVVYEGKVYDITDAPRHPSMDKTFWRHCGKTSGFEQGATARHSGSSSSRVENYGKLVGDLRSY